MQCKFESILENFADSYVDPKVEGPFSNGTADRRTRAQKYIREKIEAHETILRYYKRRWNALTETCRIPPEVLSCIFSHVVEDADAWSRSFPQIATCWIEQIAHVCFHWREVALSTPGLWSTIYVGYKTWALEMLHRSKMVPLSVILSGPFGTAYPVLKETLAFHLPRIKQIIQHRTFGTDNVEDLLESLGSRDTFLMEWLEMRASVDEAQLKLPDRVITESVSLQDISLEGLGLNWELAPAFTSLKRLDITIPLQFAPSLAQLLRFLSRIPLLETLIIDEIDPNQEPPYIAERVSLKYLNWISLSCKNLSIITAFLDHVSFPREKTTLRLRSALSPALHTLDESSATALQKLVKTIDNASDGSASSLAISDGIRFWKSKERTWLRPTLELEIETSLGNISGLNATILRSLRLDQLLSLEVSDPNDIRVWTLIGSLPHLEELLACEGNELALIETLRRVHSEPQTALYPAFPALRSLTISYWHLTGVSSSSNKTVEELLSNSLELRLEAKLPRLHCLRMQYCIGVREKGDVHHLEEFVDRVDWETCSIAPNFDHEDD